jgi:hypothetical protein
MHQVQKTITQQLKEVLKMTVKKARLNPDLIHKHHAKFATLRSDLVLKVGSTYKTKAMLEAPTHDFNKLNRVMKNYNVERKQLLSQYNKLYGPLPLSFPFCCCCCCDEPTDHFYTKNIDPDSFMVYYQLGSADAHQVGTEKEARGDAGDAQLVGPMAVPLSCVSFGFRSSFALNDEYNEITIRSGVSTLIGWYEAMTFDDHCYSSLSMSHKLMITVGMYSGSNSKVVFAHNCNQIGGGLGPTVNSELIYKFIRTGAGETVVVDESIIISALRSGVDLTRCEAVIMAHPSFAPLHIAVNTEP